MIDQPPCGCLKIGDPPKFMVSSNFPFKPTKKMGSPILRHKHYIFVFIYRYGTLSHAGTCRPGALLPLSPPPSLNHI